LSENAIVRLLRRGGSGERKARMRIDSLHAQMPAQAFVERLGLLTGGAVAALANAAGTEPSTAPQQAHRRPGSSSSFSRGKAPAKARAFHAIWSWLWPRSRGVVPNPRSTANRSTARPASRYLRPWYRRHG